MTPISLDAADARFASASGLDIRASVRPDSPVLTDFFDGYDRAFVLPDEKEDLDGFKACLALGEGAERGRLLKIYGPHREVVLTAHDPATGLRIGGANFIAYPLLGADWPGPVIAGNLNYIFVDPSARGKGAFHRLVSAVRELKERLFANAGAVRVLTFIELNDPLALTDEEYALDGERSGLDQFDRLTIWSRVGAKLLGYDYVQPPLSANQAAEDGLLCGVLGAHDLKDLDPALLHGHFERFFGISVLKGVSPASVPSSAEQLRLLEDMTRNGGRVALHDLPALVVAGRTARSRPTKQRPARLLDVAR